MSSDLAKYISRSRFPKYLCPRLYKSRTTFAMNQMDIFLGSGMTRIILLDIRRCVLRSEIPQNVFLSSFQQKISNIALLILVTK